MLIKKLKENYLSSSRTFLTMGIILYMLSILINRFGPEIGVLSFIEGFLSGISVVFSIVGLFLFGKLKRSSINNSNEENN